MLLAHPGLHLKMVFEGLQNVDRRLRGLPGVLAVAPLSVAGVLCSTRLVANELRGFCALVALVPYPCRDRLTATEVRGSDECGGGKDQAGRTHTMKGQGRIRRVSSVFGPPQTATFPHFAQFVS